MQNITSSASKIVLLWIMGILGIMALFAGIYSVATNTFGDASKVILASFAAANTFLLGFYFNSKGDTSLPNAGK